MLHGWLWSCIRCLQLSPLVCEGCALLLSPSRAHRSPLTLTRPVHALRRRQPGQCSGQLAHTLHKHAHPAVCLPTQATGDYRGCCNCCGRSAGINEKADFAAPHPATRIHNATGLVDCCCRLLCSLRRRCGQHRWQSTSCCSEDGIRSSSVPHTSHVFSLFSCAPQRDSNKLGPCHSRQRACRVHHACHVATLNMNGYKLDSLKERASLLVSASHATQGTRQPVAQTQQHGYNSTAGWLAW